MGASNRAHLSVIPKELHAFQQGRVSHDTNKLASREKKIKYIIIGGGRCVVAE